MLYPTLQPGRTQCDTTKPFGRAIAMLSFDTEQIWGHLDRLNEPQFQKQYPGAYMAHEKLLTYLSCAQISATWFVVGGMALGGSDGAGDPRLAALPAQWRAKVPAGNEATKPLWYRRTFVESLRDANPRQEIGLHGGLTHLVWTTRHAERDVLAWELGEGVAALQQLGVRARSFSFPRDQEAHHELLPAHGICCYRGRTPVLSFKLGRTWPGALLRIADELRVTAPPVVWPSPSLPGLWNIPSSLFLYPIGYARTRLVPVKTRIERFRKGLEAAVRYQGIFHFCLHPDNLAESSDGFGTFQEILAQLVHARDRGDVEVLTLGEAANRLESQYHHC